MVDTFSADTVWRMETQILRTNDVLARLNVSRSSLVRWRANGTFPQPVKLGPHAVGWRAETVERWLDERAAAVA